MLASVVSHYYHAFYAEVGVAFHSTQATNK